MKENILLPVAKNDSNIHKFKLDSRYSSKKNGWHIDDWGKNDFTFDYESKISGYNSLLMESKNNPNYHNAQSFCIEDLKKRKKRKKKSKHKEGDNSLLKNNTEVEVDKGFDDDIVALHESYKNDSCNIHTMNSSICDNGDMKTIIKTDQNKKQKDKIKDNPSTILCKEFLENYYVILYHNTLRLYDGRTYIAMNHENFLERVEELLSMPNGTKLEVHPTIRQITDTMPFMVANLAREENEVVNREEEDKNIIVFNNCIYNAYEQEIHKHNPSYLTLFSINAKYKHGHIETPVFDKFIRSIDVSGEEKKLKELILNMIGYCMCRNADGKCFFYLGTEHNAGKSVLGAFIQELFNENAICNTAIHDLNSRFSLGSLHEKALCISMDLSGTTLSADAVARLKNITGDRRIQTEEKYMPVRSTYHNCKFIFGSNYPLRTNTSDDAFWSRVVIIPFVKSFEKKEQDTNLLRNLLNEKNEIATLAARSLKRLIDNHFIFPTTKVSEAMLLKWKGDKTNEIIKFVESECILDQTKYSFTEELFNAYCVYCEDNMLRALSKTEFSKKIGERYNLTNGKRRLNGNSCHGYYGIELVRKSNNEEV